LQESFVRHTFIIIGLLATLAGCSKSSSKTEADGAVATPDAPATEAQPAEAEPVPAELPDVLARVNGESVTKAEFEQALMALEQRAGRQVPEEQRNLVYREVLDQLVGFKLISQEALARKVNVPDAELNEQLEVFKQHFGAPQEFEQALAEQQMTLEQFKEQTRSEIRMAKIMETEVEANVSVQPAAITDFYQKNPEQFAQPERVRASHILITVDGDADADTKEQARTRAADILTQVRTGGDFANLAKEHSQDQGNAATGGDLGFFARGQMVGAFERAAFALTPGQISDLVETPFGFHIIKVEEKEAGKILALEDVRPQLEEFLKQRQRQEKTQAFVDNLKAKGTVEILI